MWYCPTLSPTINMKNKLFLILVVLFTQPVFSQDILDGDKVWYSTYLNYKLNKKIYFDDYLLLSFNGLQHSFSFFQNDFNINYALSKKATLYAGYSYAMYNWIPEYKTAYSQNISAVSTIGFNKAEVGGKYDISIGKNFKIDQDLAAQFYFPQLEKYQFRFEYSIKLSYKERKTSFRFTPFVQGVIFYYQNGIPVHYYKDDGSLGDYKSPNGFHRYRAKFGLSFRPIKSFKSMGIVLYYNIQKEFNISGFGNDLNIKTPLGNITNTQNIIYPFNNYNVFGIQLNFFL